MSFLEPAHVNKSVITLMFLFSVFFLSVCRLLSDNPIKTIEPKAFRVRSVAQVRM